VGNINSKLGRKIFADNSPPSGFSQNREAQTPTAAAPKCSRRQTSRKTVLLEGSYGLTQAVRAERLDVVATIEW
jgi:hypothetical protein